MLTVKYTDYFPLGLITVFPSGTQIPSGTEIHCTWHNTETIRKRFDCMYIHKMWGSNQEKTNSISILFNFLPNTWINSLPRNPKDTHPTPPPKGVENRLVQLKLTSTISPVNIRINLLVCEVCLRIGNVVICLYWHSSRKYYPNLSFSLLEGIISGAISLRKEDLHCNSLHHFTVT